MLNDKQVKKVNDTIPDIKNLSSHLDPHEQQSLFGFLFYQAVIKEESTLENVARCIAVLIDTAAEHANVSNDRLQTFINAYLLVLREDSE